MPFRYSKIVGQLVGFVTVGRFIPSGRVGIVVGGGGGLSVCRETQLKPFTLVVVLLGRYRLEPSLPRG